MYRHKDYYSWTITFVGEKDNTYGYGKWEYKTWYGEKHLAWYNNNQGLAKGGLKLVKEYRSKLPFENEDDLLKDIAEHIINLKKRSI